MNISKENIDELNAVVKLTIEPGDYEPRVDTVLKDYRKKANMPGFRPGKVPHGLIKKMYGKAVLVDEVNKILSESLSKYITDEKLKILGEPMPSEKEEEKIDWDNPKEFHFAFDLGLTPKVELSLSKKDKIKYYDIKIDNELKKKYTDSYTGRFGSYREEDKAGEKSLLRGELKEVDDAGNIVEEGIFTDEAVLSVEMIKDEKIKKSFLGAKTDDLVVFDIKKAFPNDTEVSNLLKIDKEKVADIKNSFQLIIKQIQEFEPAEINQEFFDKAFGKDQIKSEEEFHHYIENEIRHNLEKESDYQFTMDVRDMLIDIAKLMLPEAFLKRWLLAANEGKLTEEQIEKEFPLFEKDLKWQLIKNYLIEQNDIKVTPEEVLETAKEFALMQFKQYGLASIPEEHLENYAREMLQKEEDAKRLYERKYEEKVVEFVKENVKVDHKEVTTKEFDKIVEKK